MKIRSGQALLGLQALILTLVVLYFGRSLFVPLSYALFIGMVLYPFCKWMEKHKIPRVLSITVSLIIVTIIVGGVFLLLINQAISFGEEWPVLLRKVTTALDWLQVTLAENYNISFEQQSEWLTRITENLASYAIPVMQKTIYFSTFSAVLFILIPFYVALMLYYREMLVSFIHHLFPDDYHKKINEVITGTVKTYYNFISGMIIVYLIVGLLNSIGLLLLDIPHPFLFGIIASVLTFVPYIGITIGSILPITLAWITHDSIWYPLGVVAVFTFVQYLEANVIFPLAVSYRLKVNALVSIIAIIAGGLIWGVSGMILAMPFVAILKLIADRVERLKAFSVLLGTDNPRG